MAKTAVDAQTRVRPEDDPRRPCWLLFGFGVVLFGIPTLLFITPGTYSPEHLEWMVTRAAWMQVGGFTASVISLLILLRISKKQ